MRFPEFTGEWEKFALSDFTERVTRRNKGNTCKLPLTISAQYGLVDQITFFNKQIASTDMSNYYLLKKGEFAYNKSYSGDYPWGAVKRLDRYNEGCLSSLYICFSLKPSVHSDYITHYFETAKWYQGISEIAGEGARNHGLLNIAILDYFDTKHYLPINPQEQEKIATLFNLLTERIETQNKIIEDLKTLKSAISAKLLHNSCWNDMKIHEICHTLNYKQYIAKNIQETGEFPVIQQGDNPICGYSHETPFDNYKNVLLFGDHTLSLYKPNSKFLLATDGIKVLLPTGHIKRDFLYYLLEANMPKSEGYKRHYSILKEVNVKVPPIEEQEKISGVFIAIDDKIALEQLLKSSYKAQKAFLLQQMFI